MITTNKNRKINTVFFFFYMEETKMILFKSIPGKKRLKNTFSKSTKNIVQIYFEVPIGICGEMESREFSKYIWCLEGERLLVSQLMTVIQTIRMNEFQQGGLLIIGS